MTDQPTQADRERALAVARNPEESGRLDGMFKDVKRPGATLLAIHAENERLRKSLRGIVDAWQRNERGDLNAEEFLGTIAEADYQNAQEPKMTETQAETGPNEGLVNKAYRDWVHGVGADSSDADEEVFAGGYDAGRASLAGELAETKAEVVTGDLTIERTLQERDEARAELEAEKAAHAETRARLVRNLERTEELREQDHAELTAARQARVMPSYEAVYEALRLCPDSGALVPWQLHRLTAALLRLLAPTQDSGPVGSADAATREDAGAAPLGSATTNSAQPTGASSDPPDPLPEVLPAGQRWFSDDGKVGTFTEPARWLGGWYTGRYECAWVPHSTTQGKIDKESIDWAHYRAQRARYVPSVGERAVLVASPDYTPLSWPIGRVLVRRGAEPSGNYILFDDAEEDVRSFYVHRDATWRRVEERPFCREAPPDSEIGQMHELDFVGTAFVPADEYKGRAVYQGSIGKSETPSWGAAEGTSWGGQWQFGAGLSVRGWRRAEPQGEATLIDHKGSINEVGAKPAPDTLEALGKRVDLLEGKASRIDKALYDAERDLDRRVDSQSKRLDELELQGRVTRRMLALAYDRVAALPVFTATIEIIEREERAK